MLVSHSHQFIYTKTAKSAGTSVEVYFEHLCMPGGEWTPQHRRQAYISQTGIIGYRGSQASRPADCKWWNHMPASLIREQIGWERWDAYFKFCTIRNPYEVMVSAFYHFRSKDHPRRNHAMLGRGELEADRVEFESWLGSHPLPADTDKYLIDGKCCMDDFIRYESLGDDLERICARMGVPHCTDKVPQLKAGARPENASAAALYTENAREIVRKVYAFELDFLGYLFPE